MDCFISSFLPDWFFALALLLLQYAIIETMKSIHIEVNIVMAVLGDFNNKFLLLLLNAGKRDI